MMRKIAPTIGLILLSTLIAFYGCGRAMDSSKAVSQMQDTVGYLELGANQKSESAIENNLENPEVKGGFETAAKEKLHDFINYLELISNKSINIEMRQQAAAQALALFSDTNVASVSGYFTDTTSLPPTEFISAVLNSEYDSLKVTVDRMEVKNSFNRINDSTYIGLLSITHHVQAFQHKQGKDIFKGEKLAEIVLQKKEKQFGEEKQLVWDIRLSRMR